MFHILTVQSASDEWLTQPCNWQYTINTWSPCGTGIVAAPAKQLLQLAGVQDVHTQWKGLSATMGNFLKATFVAMGTFSVYTMHSSW